MSSYPWLMANRISLADTLPAQLAIGKGQIQVLRGQVEASAASIKRLTVVVDSNHTQPLQRYELFPKGDEPSCEFFLTITWLPTWVGRSVDLVLECDIGGQTARQCVGTMQLIEGQHQSEANIQLSGDLPLIAICMATYNPPAEPLLRQVESIIAQTHDNWMLVISDDGSDDEHWQHIEQVVRIDPTRIRLHRHTANVHFYHNFERSLNYIPQAAEFVALSDQDDCWYPDKLASLLAALTQADTMLAYSDMRIVGEDGTVHSNTYWNGRNNEYEDAATVFLANTVTGAASLFRRELLDDLLPFPARVGDAFHDHWLALVALAKGRLAYVDEPLYDYYQYGDSVIGHCDFTRWSLGQRLKSAFGFAKRLLKPSSFKAWLGQKVGGGLAIYRYECLRLELFSDTIKLRLGDQAQNGAVFQMMNGGLSSFAKLMGQHARILVSGKTTDDAEFRLAMAYLARAWQRRKYDL